jgi:hypothetical protein
MVRLRAEAQSELVPAKARCHLTGATTLLNERGETRKKSINGLLAVAVVERMEIVYIEEHQRDPLVGRQRGERGNEFLVGRQSGRTIHLSMVGASSADSSGVTPERQMN